MLRRFTFGFCALVLCSPATWSGTSDSPTAEAIMARVAANQDRAEQSRAAHIYNQKIVIRLRDNSGKLVREEDSEYSVTPTAEGTKKELAAFSGRYKAKKGGMVNYTTSGQEAADRRVDIDAELVKDLRQDLVNDQKAKDGIASELFPLATREQERYEFRLVGEEKWRGLPVYRISFQPKRAGKNRDTDTRAGPWTGEALVTRDDSQPVMVTTRLANNVPVVIRALLGSDLQGLGFSVRYDKFDGVWFPVSFGAEFRVRALFFYKRLISVSMQGSGFRRADVASTIRYEDPP